MSDTQIQTAFKDKVRSHLFIDGTIKDTFTYIFYDVIFPSLKPNIKQCRVVMYLITHRDILDNYYREGYSGNRADVLSQMVCEALLDNRKTARSFGIGDLSLDSVNPYNSADFYGCILTFDVPTFR